MYNYFGLFDFSIKIINTKFYNIAYIYLFPCKYVSLEMFFHYLTFIKSLEYFYIPSDIEIDVCPYVFDIRGVSSRQRQDRKIFIFSPFYAFISWWFQNVN